MLKMRFFMGLLMMKSTWNYLKESPKTMSLCESWIGLYMDSKKLHEPVTSDLTNSFNI